MPSWKKVITSGSDAALNSLNVTNGATVSSSLTLSGSISNVNYIDFNTGSAIPAYKNGRIFWDNTEGALSVYNSEADVTLQVGQENWTRVFNDTGATITNGTPVRIIGTHGDHPEVVLAQSVQVSGSSNLVNQVLGLATHTIEDQTFGYVTTQGLVRGLDTSAYTDGDTLYVSSSAGQLTSTVPTAPYEIIPVGQVVKAGPGGSGIIYVAVQQPLDFTDLSSVYLGGGTYTDGDLWTYNGPNKRWEHKKQLTGSYGLTGSLNATSFTGSLLGTASWSNNAVTASYVLNAVSSSFSNTASISNLLKVTPTLISGFYPVIFTSNSYDGNIYRNQISDFYFNPSTNTLNVSNVAGNASSATTASYVLQAVSSSFASTASFVNTLNQNVLITSSLTVGSSSLGASENTITLGARDNGSEGGQLGLNAPGGTYTSASMIDNYNNSFRILKGTNAGSTGLVAQWNLHNTQMQLPGYNSPTSLPGTVSGLLAFDTSGNIITTTTGSGGGGGVTINNNVDNYIVTATGTANTLNGESGLQYNGTSLSVTGQITASGAITSTANGAMYFRGGDDAEFWDINVANTVGIYGQQTQTEAGLKLGSAGATLYGSGSRFGIATTSPVATLDVNGNLYVASGITGSLFGTASWANNVLTASFVTGSNVYGPFGSNSVTSASFAVSSSRAVTSSFALSSSLATNAGFATSASRVDIKDSSTTAGDYLVTFVAANSGYNRLEVDSETLRYNPAGNVLTVANLEGNATSATTATTASFVTGSNVYGPFGSNSILSASFAVSSSRAVSSSFASTASYVSSIASSITNNANNYILTATGGSTINGEGSLTFDGSLLTAQGQFKQGGATSATGTNSHAQGAATTAAGDYSHAEGNGTYSNGSGAHAEGNTTVATGDYSHAEGTTTTAYGTGTHSEGESTIASGSFSHSEGYTTITYGDYSHAEGYITKTGTLNAFLTGQVTDGSFKINGVYGDISALFVAGNPMVFSDIDYDNTYGIVTFIIASSTWDGSNVDITLTDDTVSTTTAVVGDLTNIGSWSSYGGDSTIYPIAAHAEGYYINALGANSHAEGNNTITSGEGAHAEGALTIAGGVYSHAEGYQTKALQFASHAEGTNTIASGSYSHAEGRYTIASGDYQHVQGTFNLASTDPGAFIIGNGTSVGSRSNLLFASGSTVQISGSLRGQVNALSIASNTASINLASNNFFTLSLVNGANTHISASNIQPGQTVNVRVTQGSLGTGTLTFNSAIKSGSLYTGSAVANAIDIMTFVSFDSSTLYMSAVTNLK